MKTGLGMGVSVGHAGGGGGWGDTVRTSYIPAPVVCPDAFEIRRLSSVFLRVRTNVGVRVLYDREGPRLYLQVDQRWVEDTVGLCGTFNGNTQDDFLYVP